MLPPPFFQNRDYSRIRSEGSTPPYSIRGPVGLRGGRPQRGVLDRTVNRRQSGGRWWPLPTVRSAAGNHAVGAVGRRPPPNAHSFPRLFPSGFACGCRSSARGACRPAAFDRQNLAHGHIRLSGAWAARRPRKSGDSVVRASTGRRGCGLRTDGGLARHNYFGWTSDGGCHTCGLGAVSRQPKSPAPVPQRHICHCSTLINPDVRPPRTFDSCPRRRPDTAVRATS